MGGSKFDYASFWKVGMDIMDLEIFFKISTLEYNFENYILKYISRLGNTFKNAFLIM